jgi:hypothetical protein
MKTTVGGRRPARLIGPLLLVLALTACSGQSKDPTPVAVTGTAGPAGISAPPATTSAAPSATAAPAVPAATTVPRTVTATRTAPPSYEPLGSPGPGQGLDFGFLTRVTIKSGAVWIEFDRATFVKDAAAPDGYRITDDSNLLRTFTVASNAALLMVDEPGSGPHLIRLTAQEFVAKATAELKDGQRPALWLRHTGLLTGTVTALTEQYLP